MKRKWILPAAFLVALAISRVPGMLPQNFSAVYALMFCAGVYLSGAMAWWVPLLTLLITDVALDVYYLSLGWDVLGSRALKFQLFNYVSYGVIILLGRRFKPGSSFFSLLGGGILGAILFYLITNTASWFFNPFGNPEYAKKTLYTLLEALTKGTNGWPQTWEFFRNTLLSGGLFTALFVGAMKHNEASESAAEKREPESPKEEPEAEAEQEPEEAKA